MTGVILENGDVQGSNGKLYQLHFSGISDTDGYPEVLMDATEVGGSGYFQRQSIKPYIGATVNFVVSRTGVGYNYKVVKLD